MINLGLSPQYAESDQVGDPEKAHHTVKYPDHIEYYGTPRTFIYENNPSEFVSKILSSEKKFGNEYSRFSFIVKSTIKHYRHTTDFYSYKNGTRGILNYVGTQGDDRAPTAQILLKLAKDWFGIFTPIYTSVDFQYKSDPQSINKSLHTRHIQELYWVNIFDSEYVNKYGKDFFTNAPVWKVEEITNGGMLVQLSPEISPASKKAINVENIAHYFKRAGLKYIAWPTNKYFKLPETL